MAVAEEEALAAGIRITLISVIMVILPEAVQNAMEGENCQRFVFMVTL